MTPLPAAFLARPLAHRGLHDKSQGRVENAPTSIMAAISAGYGIELDVQLSRDGAAMVFHDDRLDRLTSKPGLVRDVTTADLGQIMLTGGGGDTIPTLPATLAQIAGKVPLLIEIKDQDGGMGAGANIGPLEQAVAAALENYPGPVAVMSFNPHAIAAIAPLIPGIAVGLVTDRFEAANWPGLTNDRRRELRGIPDFDRIGASFISHNQAQLDDAPVTALKQRDVPILCWTIRSSEQQAAARKVADNITFEGYLP